MRFYDVAIDKKTGIHRFKAEATEEEIDFCVTHTINALLELGILALDEQAEGNDVEIMFNFVSGDH